MSKKISFTISDELYEVLRDSSHLHGEKHLSAWIRGILENEYRDYLIDEDAPDTMETRQDYFRHHLKMMILRSIINNKDVDAKNIFVKINKDDLRNQYDLSKEEEHVFFTTGTSSKFYNNKSWSINNAMNYICMDDDTIIYNLSSDYVNIVREFWDTGDLTSAVFKT